MKTVGNAYIITHNSFFLIAFTIRIATESGDKGENLGGIYKLLKFS